MTSNAPLKPKALHLLIRGRVQGVGYRAWTVRTAQKYQLSGWVRNLASGEVEAVISGDAEMLDAMVAACRKGPIAAKVSNIVISNWQEAVEAGFIRLPNA